MTFTYTSEAIVKMRSVKKMFLKTSRNPQEHNCTNWSEACNFIKKETLAHVFSCKFCENFKNIFFYKIPLVAASVS